MSDASSFTDHVAFRCPPALAESLERAAEREMTTASAYARAAVVRQLRKDGFVRPIEDRAA